MTLPALSLPWMLLLAAPAAPAAPAAADDADDGLGPNVVVIMADDLGWGDVSCNNPASKIATPAIDALAAQGMRFTDAHAPASVCVPTRYGMLTGRYPHRIDWRGSGGRPLIDPSRATWPELLSRGRHNTVMVGKWHLGLDDGDFSRPLTGGPVDHGFASFLGLPASLDIPPYYWIRDDRCEAPPTEPIEGRQSPPATGWTPIQGKFWRAGLAAPGFSHRGVLERIELESLRAIRRLGRPQRSGGPPPPFCLYVALTAPHTPWLPKGRIDAGACGIYGDFVRQVDVLVARIVREIDDQTRSRTWPGKPIRETVIVFTSDNGPVWYPKDVEKYGHSSTGPFRGMKGDAYEGGHRVPLIVRWNGKVAPGSTSAALVCQTDLMATFADALGADWSARMGEDSVSFLPVLTGASPDARTHLLTQSSRGVPAVREGHWKLIPALGSGGFSQPAHVQPTPGGPAGQLYHLGDDPGETVNLWQQKPEVVERLSALLPADAAG